MLFYIANSVIDIFLLFHSFICEEKVENDNHHSFAQQQQQKLRNAVSLRANNIEENREYVGIEIRHTTSNIQYSLFASKKHMVHSATKFLLMYFEIYEMLANVGKSMS